MFIRTLLTLSAAFSLSAFAVHPEKITSSTVEKNSFTLKTENKIDLKVSFLADDVFRIQTAPDGKFADPKNDPKKAQIIIKKGSE